MNTEETKKMIAGKIEANREQAIQVVQNKMGSLTAAEQVVTTETTTMTKEQIEELDFLELQIEEASEAIKQGWIIIAKNLKVIDDKNLWRGKYADLNDYCLTRWGFGERNAHKQIDALQAYLNIEDKAPHLLRYLDAYSTAEVLNKAEPEKQVTVLQEAVSKAARRGKDKPTAGDVKAVVESKKAPAPPKAKAAYDSISVRLHQTATDDAKAVRALFVESAIEVDDDVNSTFFKADGLKPEQVGNFLIQFGTWLHNQPVKTGLELKLK